MEALQSDLITPDMVKLFTEEFRREVGRLTRTRTDADRRARMRLAELEVEITHLAQHFLAGAVSATLSRMLAEREAEKERLERQLAAKMPEGFIVFPYPAPVAIYERTVANLREALNDEVVRTEAATTLRRLIGSVTVHVAEDGTRTLEVEASTARLIDFAETTNDPQRRVARRSIEVVAGAGFEPATFRL